jgi:hypothetical protein
VEYLPLDWAYYLGNSGLVSDIPTGYLRWLLREVTDLKR